MLKAMANMKKGSNIALLHRTKDDDENTAHRAEQTTRRKELRCSIFLCSYKLFTMKRLPELKIGASSSTKHPRLARVGRIF